MHVFEWILCSSSLHSGYRILTKEIMPYNLLHRTVDISFIVVVTPTLTPLFPKVQRGKENITCLMTHRTDQSLSDINRKDVWISNFPKDWSPMVKYNGVLSIKKCIWYYAEYPNERSGYFLAFTMLSDTE